MNNILKIKDASVLKGISVGDRLMIGDNAPVEVFGIKEDKILFGY